MGRAAISSLEAPPSMASRICCMAANLLCGNGAAPKARSVVGRLAVTPCPAPAAGRAAAAGLRRGPGRDRVRRHHEHHDGRAQLIRTPVQCWTYQVFILMLTLIGILTTLIHTELGESRC